MKRLYIFTFCSIIIAVAIFIAKNRNPSTIPSGEGLVIHKEWLQQNKNILTPKKDCRPADQTFLTFPEWYLVFSPEEQSNYFKEHTATSFPYMSHVAQIWESYAIVNNQIKGNFPANYGYQFMIYVIGTSATIEYSMKAWYELVIGRLTDTEIASTDEDKFNENYTTAYVNFIKDKPWYEFDFSNQFKKLCSSTSFFGNHFIRKLERKYILSSELIVKFIYAKLIKLGTKKVYDEALPTTSVILENDSLIYLPRYYKFIQAVELLAENGHTFKEVAGNNSAILVSVLMPSNSDLKFENTQIVFIQPIASNVKLKRVALAVPVSDLCSLLQQCKNSHVEVEHVFDY